MERNKLFESIIYGINQHWKDKIEAEGGLVNFVSETVDVNPYFIFGDNDTKMSEEEYNKYLERLNHCFLDYLKGRNYNSKVN